MSPQLFEETSRNDGLAVTIRESRVGRDGIGKNPWAAPSIAMTFDSRRGQSWRLRRRFNRRPKLPADASEHEPARTYVQPSPWKRAD